MEWRINKNVINGALCLIRNKTKAMNTITKSVQFIRRNILIIGAFAILFLFVAFYINRTFLDVPYLDGLMMVPNVGKYFDKTLTIQDINQRWFEHRLIGYSVIFLINTIVFGLNMKLDPFVFLIAYSLIGLVLYFPYKRLLMTQIKNKSSKLTDVSYLFILLIIFSLVHPPIMLMGTQFVIGTLFFLISAIFFDRICQKNEDKKLRFFIAFLVSIFIYVAVFSGAYLGGVLVSFMMCVLCKMILSDDRKMNVFLLLSILFTLALVGTYFLTTSVNEDGVSLSGKVVILTSEYRESFLTLLFGISATTLDIHTFQDVFAGREFVAMINGGILLLLGIYAVLKFIALKIYNNTYLPLMLIFFSVGSILVIRLGRLDGGWIQPMNDWYSFHLYFYLIGILWILFYDIFKRYDSFFDKSLKVFLNKNKWSLALTIFALLWIFSFQLVSNITQWNRSIYIQQWFETKRQAMLFPTDESLKTLLWPPEESLAAINILKEHKLSVFRDVSSKDIIKLTGWSLDGWISKNATAVISGAKKGVLTLNVSLPRNIYTKIYSNSIELDVVVNGVVVNSQDFSSGAFDNNPVVIASSIPKNETLDVEIRLSKSFVPVEHDLSSDSRELGIVVNKFEVE